MYKMLFYNIKPPLKVQFLSLWARHFNLGDRTHLWQKAVSTFLSLSLYKWDVPIKYVRSDDPKNIKLIWLMKDQQSVMFDLPKENGWIKLNWHHAGFYRVNYTLSQWEAFSDQLLKDPAIFDVEDRVNLIEDAFNLAGAAYCHYYVPLNLLQYFQFGKEDHFYPWEVSSKYLRFIAARLHDTDTHPLFMECIRSLVKGNLSEDIWDFSPTKTLLAKKFQLEIIKLACWAEEEDTLKQVKALFRRWIDSGCKLHPDLTQIVYSYGLAGKVSKEEWEATLNRCLCTTSVKEKLDLWCALGKVRDKEYLIRLIELAKNENNIKSQDFFILLDSIIQHPLGMEVVWDFVRNEWLYIVERFTLDSLALWGFMFRLCSMFGTKERLSETKEFFEKYPEAGAGVQSRKRALEQIGLNIQWSINNYSSIKDWLINKGYKN